MKDGMVRSLNILNYLWIFKLFLGVYENEYLRKADTTKEESILSCLLIACTDHWSGSPTVIGKLRCMRPIFRFQEVTIERPCWRPTYMYTISRTAHSMWWAFLVLSPRVSTKIHFAFWNILPFFYTFIAGSREKRSVPESFKFLSSLYS